jgi:acetyl esterase
MAASTAPQPDRKGQTFMQQQTTSPEFPLSPDALAQAVRGQGTMINPPATKALFAGQPAQFSLADVQLQRDHRYGEHLRHVLDVYLPAEQEAAGLPKPVLIFLHGGGFIRGDKADRANTGCFFAANGVITVVPNYRLGPDSQWPAGAEDAAAVFAWVRAHAAELGADPGRIFIGGESAGAAHVAAATLVSRFGCRPAGAVLISGVYNLELEGKSRRQFGIATPDPRNDAYFGTEFAAHGAMSTVRLVDAAPFPLLLTYAELDPPQMQIQAGELYARLVVDHGFAPEVRVIANHGHLSQVYAINTGDRALTEPVLAFIREA